MRPLISVVVAENQTLVRKSLVALLKEYSGLNVVAQTDNGNELLLILKTISSAVVLLDPRLPAAEGTEVLKLIALRFPKIKVIVLDSANDLHAAKKSLMLGAAGYLGKDCEPGQLAKAIFMVTDKGFYLQEELANRILQDAMHKPMSTKPELSRREMEIFRELCNGLTEKEIAGKLNISSHTVHFHKKNIYIKTNTHNLAGLIQYSSKTELSPYF